MKRLFRVLVTEPGAVGEVGEAGAGGSSSSSEQIQQVLERRSRTVTTLSFGLDAGSAGVPAKEGGRSFGKR